MNMSNDDKSTSAAELTGDEAAAQATQGQPKPPMEKSPMSKSMHDGVEVWCDCCSCEAEPYWIEAMKENTEDG